MPFQLTTDEGRFLVKLARQAIEEHLKTGKTLSSPTNIPPKFEEKCGVFVTLNRIDHERKELRGCIGLPYPTLPLANAVIESAINSATQDPRFQSVTLDELAHMVFEVSVLTPPQLVKTETPTDYPSKIRVGQDGLIVEGGYSKGLLLPQVPVEWKWNEEEFLCQCCIKAGLSPDCWLLKDTKVYKFSCIIAREISPKGEVAVKDMQVS
ncbi:MAG: TIGR00296 family protein [Candidatus Bathyarchaeota archaeon]|nr:MAG: TIGR00296 family protein [Candidatus Bathyarchaeota archaeon]